MKSILPKYQTTVKEAETAMKAVHSKRTKIIRNHFGEVQQQFARLSAESGYKEHSGRVSVLTDVYYRILFEDRSLSLKAKLKLLNSIFLPDTDPIPKIAAAHMEAHAKVRDFCAVMKRIGHVTPDDVLHGVVSHTDHPAPRHSSPDSPCETQP